MALTVNLLHLEDQNVHLKGELSAEELDFALKDEVIHANHPLQYDLEVQKLESGLLLQGRLHLDLDCECVRCLKPFRFPLDLSGWSQLLPFEGEEAVVVSNDCVDLTPYVREDILLEFPQHPLCQPDCQGLPGSIQDPGKTASSGGKTEADKSAWSELNKLKF